MITTSNKPHTIINEDRRSASIPSAALRHWGYTHTLLKGLQKVNGEMNLIMFCYNFMRTKNILGFEKMINAIQSWQPDYSKVVGTLKIVFIKVIYRQITSTHFFTKYPLLFLKAA